MKKHISSKGKLAVSLFTAGALAVGTVGAAFADGPAQSSVKQGYFGNVTAKEGSTFTVNTRANQEIELAVDQGTQVRSPSTAEASFDDLAVGSRVAILAEEQSDTLTAVRVMLVPGEPQSEHRSLTVVEASGNAVVAEDEQGNQVTVTLEQEVNEDLTGQLVTFVGQRSQQSNRFKADARVKIGQVVQRMEAHSQRLQDQVEDAGENGDRENKERDLARLHERLESLMQQHLDRFSAVIDRAPEQARPHLEEAMETSLKGYRSALEALERPQAHIEARLGVRTTQGVISSVDSDAGQVTLKTRGGADVTLDVTSDTQVRMDGQSLNLADIAPGDPVTVRYDRESSIATEIRVKTEAKAEGVIQGIDAANHQITVEMFDGTTQTLTVSERSEVEMNGEDVSIDELPAGAQVEVEYNPATMEVLEIEVNARAEVEGTISSVDTEANTMTVLTEEGAQLTLDITDNTRVSIERILFGLTGLGEGMAVEVKYNVTTGEALEVEAEGQGHRHSGGEDDARATGTITAIDAEAREVTLTLDGGESMTLGLDAETEIEVYAENEGSMALADLLDGPKVEVEYDSETRVVSKIETLDPDSSGDSESLLPSGAPKP